MILILIPMLQFCNFRNPKSEIGFLNSRAVPKFILLPVSSMQASMGSQLLSSSYVPFALTHREVTKYSHNLFLFRETSLITEMAQISEGSEGQIHEKSVHIIFKILAFHEKN
jgi:hypothetical protein